MVLGREQGAVRRLTGTGFEIPVFNYAELAGPLLGWGPGLPGPQRARVALVGADRHPLGSGPRCALSGAGQRTRDANNAKEEIAR